MGRCETKGPSQPTGSKEGVGRGGGMSSQATGTDTKEPSCHPCTTASVRGSALSARTAERPPAVVHFLFLSFPEGKIEKRRSFVVGFRARARDVVDRERAEGAGGGKKRVGLPTINAVRVLLSRDFAGGEGKKVSGQKKKKKMERRE